jgi:hypothetical protein
MSGSTATVDAPATPSQKTFTSFETMLEQSELPVLVDFHTHWYVSIFVSCPADDRLYWPRLAAELQCLARALNARHNPCTGAGRAR